MALPFTNGNIISGSFVATIGNTTYVVNSASLSYPADSVVVTDQNGNPTAAYHWKGDLARGTAKIQVNTSASRGDLRGLAFTTNAFTGANINCLITTQEMPVAKGNARVYNVGIVEVLT